MCTYNLKIIISVLCFTLIPIPSYSETTESDQAILKVFSDACVGKWMEDANNSLDSKEMKAFGERFCGCAGTKLLPSLKKDVGKSTSETEDLQKQVSLSCLSETVLQHTVNSFGKDENVSEQKLESTCNKSWAYVIPKEMSADQKQYTESYCRCTAAPLASLTDQEDKLSDEQYNEKVSSIAAECQK